MDSRTKFLLLWMVVAIYIVAFLLLNYDRLSSYFRFSITSSDASVDKASEMTADEFINDKYSITHQVFNMVIKIKSTSKESSSNQFLRQAKHNALVPYTVTIDVDDVSTTFQINKDSITSTSYKRDAMTSSDPSNPKFLVQACTSSSNSNSSGLPRIIHQSWKTHQVPEKFRAWQSSWKSFHPDWEYRLWSDEDNLKLVNSSYPWFLATYLSFPKAIMRVDAARYCYMHKYGGIYADLDMECLASHSPLAQCGSILLPLLSNDYKFAHNIPNAWMASPRNHPFWIFVLKNIMEAMELHHKKQKEARDDPTRKHRDHHLPSSSDLYVEAVAGPCRLKEAAREYANKFQDQYFINPQEGPIRYIDSGLIFPFDWHHRYKSSKVAEYCSGGQASATVANFKECKKLLIHSDPTGSISSDVQQFLTPYAITYWSHTWSAGNDVQ